MTPITNIRTFCFVCVCVCLFFFFFFARMLNEDYVIMKREMSFDKV